MRKIHHHLRLLSYPTMLTYFLPLAEVTKAPTIHSLLLLRHTTFSPTKNSAASTTNTDTKVSSNTIKAVDLHDITIHSTYSRASSVVADTLGISNVSSVDRIRRHRLRYLYATFIMALKRISWWIVK
jgi:hypothetical protein